MTVVSRRKSIKLCSSSRITGNAVANANHISITSSKIDRRCEVKSLKPGFRHSIHQRQNCWTWELICHTNALSGFYTGYVEYLEKVAKHNKLNITHIFSKRTITDENRECEFRFQNDRQRNRRMSTKQINAHMHHHRWHKMNMKHCIHYILRLLV